MAVSSLNTARKSLLDAFQQGQSLEQEKVPVYERARMHLTSPIDQTARFGSLKVRVCRHPKSPDLYMWQGCLGRQQMVLLSNVNLRAHHKPAAKLRY